MLDRINYINFIRDRLYNINTVNIFISLLRTSMQLFFRMGQHFKEQMSSNKWVWQQMSSNKRVWQQCRSQDKMCTY